MAEPTKIQSLVDITDFDTGEPVDIVQFIRRETRLVIQDRNIMRSRYRAEPANPWLVCTLCGAAVQLVSHMDRRFYFRHMPEEENRGCPVNTKGQFSADEINAMKYNGAKEGLAHQRLKEIVRDGIQADPRFDTPLVERVWRGMERKTWRKPDVQTTWGDRKFAFEIQLSTTFLSVIVDRRDFYRAENEHLIWIFRSFDPHRTRRAEEDIFYNNNSNVFVVNQQTLQQSRQAQRLMLECWYAVSYRHDGHIEDEWYRKEVFIDDLTLDLQRHAPTSSTMKQPEPPWSRAVSMRSSLTCVRPLNDSGELTVATTMRQEGRTGINCAGCSRKPGWNFQRITIPGPSPGWCR